MKTGLKIPFVSSPFTLLLCLMLSGVASRAQDPFTRITSGAIVSGINSTILAWGDFNNDTFQDLFVSTRSGPSLLYSNNGNGTFTRVTAGPIAADNSSCFGATWGDYDNDGFLDLFVAVNNFGSDWLYHNNGNGSFTKITSGAIVNSGANGNNCSWADYDIDGFLDLFVCNSDQNDFLFHNNRDGTFTRITANAIGLKTGNSQGGSWADYDEDGLPDLFVSRINEPNLLYHNEGGGAFRSVTNGIVVQDISVGQGTSWGDYDNDGHLDLFVVNPNRTNFLYRNNGDGTFSKITNDATVTNFGNGEGCGWADYDNDGYLDLFVANRQGVSFLYRNSGDGTFTRVTNSVVATDSADHISGAWADYNNDGFQDLFVTELNTINNRLFHNNGNSNNWLTIRCEGRLSNRSAIGAKVRTKATINGNVLWQLREISGGGGLGSQNDLRAGFGLGDATNAELVRVEWPSGLVQQLTNVAARQFLTIVEPSASITPAVLNPPAGTTATFTLQTDFEPPLHWQWNLNGVALSGETNGELVITNLQREHAGNYTVSITNLLTGFAYTTPAASLGGPLIILQQPGSRSVYVGSNVTFSIMATGSAPAFQWRCNGTNLAGATNSTFTLTNVQIVNEGDFSVIVSNSYGAVLSSNATLFALLRPAFTAQPLSQSVVAGGTVTLSAGITGYPLPFAFRWIKGGSTITNITGNNSNSFITFTNIQPPVPPGQLTYRVLVTNLAGSANSATAIITVLADTDGDGLPDEWETAHGLNPTNSADGAWDADADGDGAANAAEYRAGTNPTNAHSRLAIEVAGGGTAAMTLRWSAVSNRTYRVERRAMADAGVWNPFAELPARPTNGTVEIQITGNTNTPANFYRLVTPNAPP
jgi:hypothetical protein